MLCHDDADGLSAGAILARALARANGAAPHVRVVSPGAAAWSPATRADLAALKPGGVVVTDLGVQAGAVLPGVPTVLVDHHVPRSAPDVISARINFAISEP